MQVVLRSSKIVLLVRDPGQPPPEPRIIRRLPNSSFKRQSCLAPPFHARQGQARHEVEIGRLVCRTLCEAQGFIPAPCIKGVLCFDKAALTGSMILCEG